jgi:small subunit ribosomal protein S17
MSGESKAIKNKVRKKLQGNVVSAMLNNTIKVRVERKYPHPLYKKIVATHKNYLVHCEDSTLVIGDKVIIEEGKPISKSKNFYFIKKIS